MASSDLPDVDALPRDRSGGGRKWHTLALALHRETAAYLTIPTEGGGERVRRRHAVLRPRHLSAALVSNSILRAVTAGDLQFAHPDAVASMCLEGCLDTCAVHVVVDCLRLVFERTAKAHSTEAAAGSAATGGNQRRGGGHAGALQANAEDDALSEWMVTQTGGTPPRSIRAARSRKAAATREDAATTSFVRGDADSSARGSGSGGGGSGGGGSGGGASGGGASGGGDGGGGSGSSGATGPSLEEALLLDLWRYFTAEYTASLKPGQGEDAGKEALRCIVDALVGGMSASTPPSASPLRVFPVRGTTTLRQHSEHGVPLCDGLSPQLEERGPSVAWLAERIVPQLDLERLRSVEGIGGLMRFLRVRAATPADLDSELQNCLRFGLRLAAPQLWWDAFRYAVAEGHARGLADLVGPNAPVPLPTADSRTVSSRDVTKLNVSLPCLLGLVRKHTGLDKHTLALPPSVTASWEARVQWELAMVRAFGTAFPRADASRLATDGFGTDLLSAISHARAGGKLRALHAVRELLGVYEGRMGAFVPTLRTVLQFSTAAEHLLLERRVHSRSFPASCTPKYVDGIVTYAGIGVADPGVMSFLTDHLGILSLREGPPPHAEPNDEASHAEPTGTGTDTGTGARPTAAGVGGSEASHAEPTGARPTAAGVGGSAGRGPDGIGPREAARAPHCVESDESDADLTTSDAGGAGGSTSIPRACDEATWDVLERLLGVRHSFDPCHCSWLLYSVLTPVLTARDAAEQRGSAMGGGGSSLDLHRRPSVHVEQGSAASASGVVEMSSSRAAIPLEMPTTPVTPTGERFMLQTKRVWLGTWDCGPTNVILRIGKDHPSGVLEFYPAEGHGLRGGQYPQVLYDFRAVMRFEIDKAHGTLCFWAMWEPPFMDLLELDTYAPFVGQDQPESSLCIQYDQEAFLRDHPGTMTWPSQIVRSPPARARPYRATARPPAPFFSHSSTNHAVACMMLRRAGQDVQQAQDAGEICPQRPSERAASEHGADAELEHSDTHSQAVDTTARYGGHARASRVHGGFGAPTGIAAGPWRALCAQFRPGRVAGHLWCGRRVDRHRVCALGAVRVEV